MGFSDKINKWSNEFDIRPHRHCFIWPTCTGWFSNIRQFAPMCTPCNTCFFWPTRVLTQVAPPSLQPVLHSSRRSVFGHVPLPTHMGDPNLHLIHGSFSPPERTTQTASQSVQLHLPECQQACQLSRHNLPSQNCPLPWGDLTLISTGSAVLAGVTAVSPGMPCPLKVAPLHRSIWTPSSTWFHQPTQAHNPNGISIGFLHNSWQCRQSCPGMSFP